MYVCTCASVRLFLLPFLPLPCLYLLDYNNLMVISHIISSLTHPPPPPFHAVFSSFSLSLRPYFSHIHHFSASVHFFFFLSERRVNITLRKIHSIPVAFVFFFCCCCISPRPCSISVWRACCDSQPCLDFLVLVFFL